MDKSQLSELLVNAGLGEYKEAILEYAKPCIRLHASLAEDGKALALGASHIGGLPDLPPDVAWPMRNGRPCEFIAQVNLKEATAFDQEGLLPREGLLLFFFDGRFYEDVDLKDYQSGSETIIYYNGDMALLKRAYFPESLEEFSRYRTCSLKFEISWMLPPASAAAAFLLEREVLHCIHTGVYDEVPPSVEIYRQLTHSLIPHEDRDKHHIGGYPEPIIQDDPLIAVPGIWDWDSRTVNKDRLTEWMLLLQISSDNLPNIMWGDTGSLYYCISKQDFLARQFENALCFEQSY